MGFAALNPSYNGSSHFRAATVMPAKTNA
jgi:hypothetical protein